MHQCTLAPYVLIQLEYAIKRKALHRFTTSLQGRIAGRSSLNLFKHPSTFGFGGTASYKLNTLQYS